MSTSDAIQLPVSSGSSPRFVDLLRHSYSAESDYEKVADLFPSFANSSGTFSFDDLPGKHEKIAKQAFNSIYSGLIANELKKPVFPDVTRRQLKEASLAVEKLISEEESSTACFTARQLLLAFPMQVMRITLSFILMLDLMLLSLGHLTGSWSALPVVLIPATVVTFTFLLMAIVARKSEKRNAGAVG